MRRALFEQTGGFRDWMESGSEDWDLWLSAHELGWRGAFVDEELFHYRQHATAGSRNGHLRADPVRRAFNRSVIVLAHAGLYRPFDVEVARRVVQRYRGEVNWSPRSADAPERLAALIERNEAAETCRSRLAETSLDGRTLVYDRADWTDVVRRLTGGGRRPLFLWGIGARCRELLAVLDRERLSIEGLLDSDPSRIGQYCHGHPVVPTPPVEQSPRPAVIVASMYADEIAAALTSARFEPGRDFLTKVPDIFEVPWHLDDPGTSGSAAGAEG